MSIWIDEMPFLLDTNILIAMCKQRPGLADRLEGIPADAVLLSSVVVAEIEYGSRSMLRLRGSTGRFGPNLKNAAG